MFHVAWTIGELASACKLLAWLFIFAAAVDELKLSIPNVPEKNSTSNSK